MNAANAEDGATGAAAAPRALWWIRRPLRRHGLFGTMRLAWRMTVGRILGRGALRRIDQHEREFDRMYNVDTAGHVRVDALGVTDPGVQFASAYRAIDPRTFEAVLNRLDIIPKQFTFVDFGSGKGRAVLLASKLPFRKVIGVEFSPHLYQVACRNAGTFPADMRRCDDIEFVCGDAAHYELPEGNLVLFFYNPFEQNVMDLVVANIDRSLALRARTVYLVLANVPFPVRPAGFRAVPLPVEGRMPITVLRSNRADDAHLQPSNNLIQ